MLLYIMHVVSVCVCVCVCVSAPPPPLLPLLPRYACSWRRLSPSTDGLSGESKDLWVFFFTDLPDIAALLADRLNGGALRKGGRGGEGGVGGIVSLSIAFAKDKFINYK